MIAFLRRLFGLDRKPKPHRVKLGFAVTKGHPLPAWLVQRADIVHSASGGKWRSSLDKDLSQSIFDYHGGEFSAVLKTATSLKKRSRHHTAFWPKPDYAPPTVDIFDAKARRAAFTQHITSWYGSDITNGVTEADVLNEVLALKPTKATPPECFKSAPGAEPLTDDEMFAYLRAAEKARPGMELGINEHSIHKLGKKLDAMVGLVKRLKRRGARIVYVGIQGHISCEEWVLGGHSKGEMVKAVQALRATGVKVRITEADFRLAKAVPVGYNRISHQTAVAREFAEACLESGVESITFWDWKDSPDNWLVKRDQDRGLPTTIADIKPCPFNETGLAKPYWTEMSVVLGWNKR